MSCFVYLYKSSKKFARFAQTFVDEQNLAITFVNLMVRLHVQFRSALKSHDLTSENAFTVRFS